MTGAAGDLVTIELSAGRTSRPDAHERVGAWAASHRWALVLTAQIAVAMCTSLWAIGRKSLWLDEGFAFAAAAQSLGDLARFLVTTESNMASFYALLHLWSGVGSSEGFLRTLPALFFVACVPVLATVLDRSFGRRAAVIGGFLLAVNPFAVMYAQELRAYSMAMFCVTASTALLIEAVRRPRAWVTVAYVAISVLSFTAHYFAFLVFAAQVAALLWVPHRREVWRRLAVPLVSIVVIASPLLLFIASRSDAKQIGWIPPLTAAGIVDVGRRFTGGNHAALWQVVVLGSLLAVAAWHTVRQTRRRRTVREWSRLLVWTWLLVPILVALLASLVKDLWLPRYLIVALPPFVGLAAVGIAKLPWRPVQWAASALVAGIFVAGLTSYYPGSQRFGEDWRSLAQHLAGSDVRGHGVIFDPVTLRYGTGYYIATGTLPRPDNPTLSGDELHARSVPAEQVQQWLREDRSGTVYVVERDGSPPTFSETLLTGAGYSPRTTEQFGKLTVTEWHRSL